MYLIVHLHVIVLGQPPLLWDSPYEQARRWIFRRDANFTHLLVKLLLLILSLCKEEAVNKSLAISQTTRFIPRFH